MPVLHPFLYKKLLFIKYSKNTILKLNKFNIFEPELKYNKIIKLEKLDIVIIPIVAFDIKGNRLGSGHGYYDRTFQNYKKYKLKLVGLAYDFQKVVCIKNTMWDIPLHSIITSSKIYTFDNIINPLP